MYAFLEMPISKTFEVVVNKLGVVTLSRSILIFTRFSHVMIRYFGLVSDEKKT